MLWSFMKLDRGGTSGRDGQRSRLHGHVVSHIVWSHFINTTHTLSSNNKRCREMRAPKKVRKSYPRHVCTRSCVASVFLALFGLLYILNEGVVSVLALKPPSVVSTKMAAGGNSSQYIPCSNEPNQNHANRQQLLRNIDTFMDGIGKSKLCLESPCGDKVSPKIWEVATGRVRAPQSRQPRYRDQLSDGELKTLARKLLHVVLRVYGIRVTGTNSDAGTLIARVHEK